CHRGGPARGGGGCSAGRALDRRLLRRARSPAGAGVREPGPSARRRPDRPLSPRGGRLRFTGGGRRQALETSRGDASRLPSLCAAEPRFVHVARGRSLAARGPVVAVSGNGRAFGPPSSLPPTGSSRCAAAKLAELVARATRATPPRVL